MTATAAGVTWLRRTWWVIVPPAAALIVRLAFERACADPYELLPEVSAKPYLAWPLATLYLAVQGWVVTVYLVTSERAGKWLPGPGDLRDQWGKDAVKVGIAIALLALEYSPIALWRLVGRSVLHCTT